MARELTARFCESVKSDGSRTSYPDSLERGLELRVSADGRKAWSFRYRNGEGRQCRVQLGLFPSLDLKGARGRAAKLRLEISEGTDPAAEKRKEKHQSQAQPVRTFNDLADVYLQVCATGEWKPKGKKKRYTTLVAEGGILARHVRPRIGRLPLEEVTRPVVKSLLRSMVSRGIHAQTNRTQAVIRQCFSFAVAEERVQINPATGFQPFGTEVPRARVYSDDELRRLWRAFEDPSHESVRTKGAGERVRLTRGMAIALQLCMLLLQRKGEIVGMRLCELNLDQAIWLIPAERMKSNRPHLVPLPQMAVDLIQMAMRLARLERGGPVDHVFPSPRGTGESMRPTSVSQAFQPLAKAAGVVGGTVHDFRRTGATMLTSERLGVSPFIRSKILSHGGDTGGGAVVSSVYYDVNLYTAEKRRALEAWERLLLDIVGERSPSLALRAEVA